jgi:pyruvate dehydrogenase E1 component alpha subunit
MNITHPYVAWESREAPTLKQQLPNDFENVLKKMYEIRFFEDEVQDLYSAGLVRGSTHLYQGQEAVSVGAISALRSDDTMTCTYRSHGATIAKGAQIDACFAELLGRAGGLCNGKGGSMHFTDASIGALGSNAIVGGHLPIANGAALAAKFLGTGKVSVCFFGDGATNIGAFHESLNLASLWKLPVIFVVENNQYGEYSPVKSTTSGEKIVDRALGYAMYGVQVDGNDVVSMSAIVADAADRARRGDGPTLIEAVTYRHSGHSRADLAAYRPEGELDEWMKRDPILLLENAIKEFNPDGAQTIERIKENARIEVSEAKNRAVSWPEPDLSELYTDVMD